MIRRTVRPLALAAAGLLASGVAWAQAPDRLVQVSSPTQNVASEYFGGEARVVSVSKMDLDGTAAETQRPFVGLDLAAAYGEGNVAEITFTLSGATFQQAATSTNLDLRGAGTGACRGDVPSPSPLKVSVANGGAIGDTSVTFRAEATSALADTQFICFWVPDLSVTLASVGTGATTARVVEVTASTRPTATTGTPFPNGPARGTMAVMANGQNTYPIPPESKRILVAVNALNALLVNGGTGQVNIADRTKIARGGKPDPSVTGSGAKTTGLVLGRISLALPAEDAVWKLDGSGAISHTALDSSLSGQVKLSVGGRFQSGDMVVYGSGATALKATISGNMAELTVPLAAGSNEIVYVPGGVDALQPARFTTGAAYLFNDRRNNNAMIRTATGVPVASARISYLGINVEGYAYGVVRGGGMETSYGRVTCESSATGTCAIFADCTGQDGTSYFGAAPPIPVGETAVWDSDAISTVLGGGWDSGRGRCDIHSNGELSVQHMVRSGHALINNSTVVGRGLDEREGAQTRSDFQATWDVLDNICRSVGDVNDATDRDDDAANTQLTMCGPAAPWRTIPSP